MKSSNHCLENHGNFGIRKGSRLMIVRSLFKKIGTNEIYRLAKEKEDLQRANAILSSLMDQIMKENEALKAQSNSEKRIDIEVTCIYCDINVNDMDIVKHIKEAHTSCPEICKTCDTELRNEFELSKHIKEYHTCR